MRASKRTTATGVFRPDGDDGMLTRVAASYVVTNSARRAAVDAQQLRPGPPLRAELLQLRPHELDLPRQRAPLAPELPHRLEHVLQRLREERLRLLPRPRVRLPRAELLQRREVEARPQA